MPSLASTRLILDSAQYTAARYFRQAEEAGNKTIGNSWIWKPKYDPPEKRK
ncbi:hypothetical protein J3458_003081 [Metarhizium acridum]|uniref:uncharacterized protein n=1 Tax=Metarhizium acridum TaxID=92637 RepID=UPI001C6A9BC1|nr:hypothetical protein J3458_003081 [Metarhizium acridum]